MQVFLVIRPASADGQRPAVAQVVCHLAEQRDRLGLLRDKCGRRREDEVPVQEVEVLVEIVETDLVEQPVPVAGQAEFLRQLVVVSQAVAGRNVEEHLAAELADVGRVEGNFAAIHVS